MAQTKTKTKTRASSKRSAGSKGSQARSRSASSKPRSRKAGKPSPVVAVGNAADKTTDTIGSATTAVGHAAKRAKMPLVAGGAALAGAAGGAVLGARQARRHRGRGLAKTAKGVGVVGTQVGRLASEMHQAREAGNGKSRSPIEIVLEGLTSRRGGT